MEFTQMELFRIFTVMEDEIAQFEVFLLNCKCEETRQIYKERIKDLKVLKNKAEKLYKNTL